MSDPMVAVPGSSLAVNGTRLFHHAIGAGRPVLFMHGGLGLDHSYFLPWMEPLGEAAQLHFYDHRGNGRSERPADSSEATFSTFVEDADALRAALGHERFTLIGHSFGSFIALEYALRYPERLDGLVLCGSAPVFDYLPVVQSNAMARGTPEQLATLSSVLSAPLATDEQWRNAWRTLLPLYFHRFREEIGTQLDRSTRYAAQAQNTSNRLLGSFNVLDRLGSIRARTLIIAGLHDWICPVAQGGERLRAGIPGAQLSVFEQSGHFPFIEEPERFVSVLREWLAGR